ncbi:MAG: hypothetical protein ACE5FP_09690, partial [Gemmatimonadota bacterium]
MAPEAKIQREVPADGADELLLAGVNDVHLKTLSKLADLRVILRRDKLILSGPPEAVERSVPVARRMIRLARLQRGFDSGDVERFFVEAQRDPADAERELHEEEGIALPGARKVIRPKSEGQRGYLNAMSNNDIVV